MAGNNHNEECYVIPIGNDFLIYSPFNQISAMVNRTGLKELQKQLHLISNNMGDIESKLFGLADDISNTFSETPKSKTGGLDPEFIGLITTRSCNGMCIYCDFGSQNANPVKMSYRKAAGFIDWYAGLLKAKGRNDLEIHFFGGEPMIAQDVIETAVQRARLLCSEMKLNPYFEISTNGQYSPALAGFLGAYFKKVVLSIDGFKEVLDRHRPLKEGKSSYNNAVQTARIISDSSAELCVRCCISRENVHDMEGFTKWLCEKFRISAINFEILVPSLQSESAGLLPPDPIEFAVNFQRSRKFAEDFGVEVVYASDISEIPVVSSCPVGKDTAILAPDGRISSCYLLQERWQSVGLDLEFGFVKSDGQVIMKSENIEEIRKTVLNKPRCINCFCRWSCAGGCHVGTTFPGCTARYNDFCRQTRVISTFSLLSDMGMYECINDLLNEPDSLIKINNQVSDRIQDYY
jgi:uncharacterized protein